MTRAQTYDTIAVDIEDRIRAAEWLPEARIPSQAQMAAHYGVHRNTISDAYRLLRERRIIRTRKGLAAYVAAADQLAEALATLDEQRRRDAEDTDSPS